MSFLSASDIRFAWELAFFLYEKCFTRAERAGESPRSSPPLSPCSPQGALSSKKGVSIISSSHPIPVRTTCQSFQPLCANEGWNELDLKYLRFGREIQSLGQSLRQLEQITDNARKDRIISQFGSDERGEEDDIYRVQLQPLSDMTGDFQETLEECNTLLNNHKHFRRNAANFIDNVIWHTTVERDILVLTERLQFHVTKVLFILKPLEM